MPVEEYEQIEDVGVLGRGGVAALLLLLTSAMKAARAA